jgi:hypothetical protein
MAAEPATQEQPAAKAPKAAKKPKKEPKAAKGAKVDASADKLPSVAGHPRAARSVARAKSWGGLIGFALGAYFSAPTNTLAGTGLRALAAGVICYVATWAGAVFVWRRVVVLELRGREAQLIEAAVGATLEQSPGVTAPTPNARTAS